MNWTDSSGRIDLTITRAQAEAAAHPGQCDVDVKLLSDVPAIRRQLAKLKPAHVAAHLLETGGWEMEELGDEEKNLQRLLWLACGDINDGSN